MLALFTISDLMIFIARSDVNARRSRKSTAHQLAGRSRVLLVAAKQAKEAGFDVVGGAVKEATVANVHHQQQVLHTNAVELGAKVAEAHHAVRSVIIGRILAPSRSEEH